MDGKEALIKIRETGSKVPIMMLSSISDEDIIAECEQASIEGYILKPIDPELGPKIFERIVKDLKY